MNLMVFTATTTFAAGGMRKEEGGMGWEGGKGGED